MWPTLDGTLFREIVDIPMYGCCTCRGGPPPPRRALGALAFLWNCVDLRLLAPDSAAAMQESGKLLYTSQAPDDGNTFDEPVDILPSVAAFSCHVDSIGNVHVNNINSKSTHISRQSVRRKIRFFRL